MVQLIPKSGAAASVEILRLTLEDQQYLKGWLDQQQGAKSTNLRVTITSSASSTGRERDIYTVQHRNLVYTVKVQNLDRRDTGISGWKCSCSWATAFPSPNLPLHSRSTR
ncbi:MAG: hypothetical protein R3F31_18725 [Verrucomicrobiales bacterium]